MTRKIASPKLNRQQKDFILSCNGADVREICEYFHSKFGLEIEPKVIHQIRRRNREHQRLAHLGYHSTRGGRRGRRRRPIAHF